MKASTTKRKQSDFEGSEPQETDIEQEEADQKGQKVFGAIMEEKISKMQLHQMENRLNKLEEEENRAQQMIHDNKRKCRDLDNL